MSLSTVLAKALFDNTAESPEELAFRKGDILMVVERGQGGGPGWWLCSLHGRQGIAPANRLRLLQTQPEPLPVAVARAGADGRGGEGGRPRSHSSSGARLRPDWDVGGVLGAAGRPRSPSLRGRGAETAALYQTPTAGATATVYLSPRPGAEPEDTYLVPRETAAPAPRSASTGDDVYQTPTAVAAPPVHGTPPGVYQTPRTPLPQTPPAGQASPGLRAHRGSPMLLRAAGHSPGSARKPPPPAPPVRSVTRKDLLPPAPPQTQAGPRPLSQDEDRQRGGLDGQSSLQTTRGDAQDYEDPVDEQVYDTPPSGRWQRPLRPVLGEDESIYNTPRTAPPKADRESEVYNVPTITLNTSTTDLHHHDDDGANEDVYSVPTLPGVPSEEADPRDHTSDASERDGGGIYDMPALVAAAAGDRGAPLPHSSSSSSSSTRRLSGSSGGSGDAQWREDGSGGGAVGAGRPRLPSQDSLSRRPLPALPGPDAGGGGMGSRKGSWIQERPLPPTPQPAFPLPPPLLTRAGSVHGDGDHDDDDDPGNEYAGIGLTPIPAPLPAGDSVGYVKLQGKPEPHPEAPTENGHTITADPRPSPSPPLPVAVSLEDSELLSFYSSQSLAHLSCLADAIDELVSSVQGNQPPRVFVARGKSLIVTAHKLVFIGDTLSRILTYPDLRAKVTTSGARLCQALKAVVMATKGAAQNYPSVSAVQEMMDRVAELSQQAAGFSGLLQRLAEIS